MRTSCKVLIYINLKKAIEGKLKFLKIINKLTFNLI
jgi:hypothetical protein